MSSRGNVPYYCYMCKVKLPFTEVYGKSSESNTMNLGKWVVLEITIKAKVKGITSKMWMW